MESPGIFSKIILDVDKSYEGRKKDLFPDLEWNPQLEEETIIDMENYTVRNILSQNRVNRSISTIG